MSESHEQRHLPRGPFSLAFFGMAFARAWVSLVFVLPGAGAPFTALPHGVFDVAYVLASLLAATFARRIVPHAGRPWAFLVTLAGMLAASAAFVLAPSPMIPGSARDALSVVAAFVGGAAFLSCSLLNAEALAGTSLLRITLYLSGSSLFGSVLIFFLRWVPAVQMGALVLLLPVISIALIHGAWGSLAPADRQKAGYPRCALPWKLFALLALFSLVYGLRSETLAAGAGRHSSISTALVAGAIFFVAYFFPHRFDVARLCRAPLPLMLCGVLLLPVEDVLGQAVSSYLVSMGFTLMTLITGVLIYDMSKRTGMAIVPLVATRAATQAFVMLGGWLPGWLDGVVGVQTEGVVVSVVVCAAMLVLFFLLFSQRDLVERWGMRVLEAGSLAAEDSREADVLARCAELAASRHLTPREEEVLRELARGKSSKDIMRNLVIAPGTFKAHVRHIYEKLDVHSRDELYEMVGVRAAGGVGQDVA